MFKLSPAGEGVGGGRAKLIYYASQNKFMILSVETVLYITSVKCDCYSLKSVKNSNVC